MQEVPIEIIAAEFVKFLRKHRIMGKFYYNAIHHHSNKQSVIEFYSKKRKLSEILMSPLFAPNYIFKSFIWCETKEDDKFWVDKYHKWAECLNNLVVKGTI